MAKSNDLTLLLKTNLKQLRLPTMLAEFEKLAREASAGNEDYQQYLIPDTGTNGFDFGDHVDTAAWGKLVESFLLTQGVERKA